MSGGRFGEPRLSLGRFRDGGGGDSISSRLRRVTALSLSFFHSVSILAAGLRSSRSRRRLYRCSSRGMNREASTRQTGIREGRRHNRAKNLQDTRVNRKKGGSGTFGFKHRAKWGWREVCIHHRLSLGRHPAVCGEWNSSTMTSLSYELSYTVCQKSIRQRFLWEIWRMHERFSNRRVDITITLVLST